MVRSAACKAQQHQQIAFCFNEAEKFNVLYGPGAIECASAVITNT